MQSRGIVRAAGVVGFATLLSRILGYVRDMVIAYFFGTGDAADAFFVAFKLPNLFRRIFAEGAFNAAFVPLFARHLEQEGKAAAQFFAEQTLSVMLTTLFVLTAAAVAAMPWLLYVLAPGFSADPEKYDLAVQLTRITFPYLLFMSLAALLSGILNSLYRFAAAAAAPPTARRFASPRLRRGLGLHARSSSGWHVVAHRMDARRCLAVWRQSRQSSAYGAPNAFEPRCAAGGAPRLRSGASFAGDVAARITPLSTVLRSSAS